MSEVKTIQAEISVVETAGDMIITIGQDAEHVAQFTLSECPPQMVAMFRMMRSRMHKRSLAEHLGKMMGSEPVTRTLEDETIEPVTGTLEDETSG